MSRSIDERIVEMQFNNAQFERGIKTSTNSLEKLKQSLDFKGATDSISSLEKAGNRFTFGGMAGTVDTVIGKFSAFEIAGITAIQNITNSAINMGKQLVSSLSVDQITAGFSKYEDKTKAVQTIVNATGLSIEEVNNELSKLNWYTDETSYNFTDMVANIGKFTSMGIDLDKSVTAMQGISNWAALSGQGINEAGRAMYNLSQAMGVGAVKLMDWRSIELASMGTKEFKEIVMETAQELGTLDENFADATGTIVSYENFSSTLSSGWFSSDVLLATLEKYGEYSNRVYEEVQENGGAAAEAMERLEDGTDSLGERAFKAAQEAKTFTEAIEATKDAVSTGWMTTSEIIFGDYEEAKELWTDLANGLWDVFASGGEGRNDTLFGGLATGWKQLLDVGITDADGFQKALLTVGESYNSEIGEIIAKSGSFKDSLKEGWVTADILGDTINMLADGLDGLSEEQLASIGYTSSQAKEFKNLKEQVDNGTLSLEDMADILQRDSGRENIIQGIKNALNGVASVIAPIKEALSDIFPATTSEQIYDLTKRFVEFTETLTISDETAQKIKDTFSGLFTIVKTGWNIFKTLVGYFVDFLSFLSPISGFLLDITGSIGKFVSAAGEAASPAEALGNAFESIKTSFENLANSFKEKYQVIAPFIDALITFLKTAATEIGEAFADLASNFSFKKIFDLLNAELAVGVFVGIKNIVTNVKDIVSDLGGTLSELAGTPSGIVGILNDVQNSLSGWQQTLQADILIKLAAAVALLAGSMVLLSLIDADKLGPVLIAVSALVGELVVSLKALSKITSGSGGKLGQLADSLSTIGVMATMAASLLILSVALNTIADLDWNQLAVGLVGIAGMATALVLVVKALSGNSGELIKGMTGLIAFSASMLILAQSIKSLSSLSWGELAKGLVGVGVLCAEIVGFLKLADLEGIGVLKVAALIELAAGIKVLAGAVDQLGNMDTDDIVQGVIALGVILGELALFTGAVNGAGGMINTATGILIISAAMKVLSGALDAMGQMSVAEIAKSLITMGLALTEITVALNFLPANTVFIGVGLMAVASALVTISNAMTTFGSLTVGELVTSLIALAGALTAIVLASKAMTGALAGAGAILILSAALAVLTPQLIALSKLTVGELITALASVAGTFVIFGVAATVLAPVTPVMLALSGALLIFGAAVLAIGAGVTLLAVGLLNLATTAVEGANALIAALPAITDALGQLILSVLQVIKDCAPAIMDTVATLILAFLQTLVDYGPQILIAGGQLIWDLLVGAMALIPEILNLAYNMVLAFVQGLADSDIVQVGKDFISWFVEGILGAVSSVWDAAKSVASSAINGLKSIFSTDAASAGEDFITGFANGVTSSSGKAYTAGAVAGEAAKGGLQTSIDAHSPSEWAYAMGGYFGEGFSNGIEDESYTAWLAGANLGDSAKEGLAASFQDWVSSMGLEDIINNVTDTTTTATTTSSGSGSKSAASSAASTAKKVTEAYDDAISLIESRITSKESSYNLWEATLGLNATETEKTEKNIELLTDKIDYQTQIVEQAEKRYNAAAKEYGEDSKDTIDQYNNWLNEQVELAELQEELSETQDSIYDSVINEYAEQQEIAAAEYTYWTNTNKLASKSEKTAKEIENVNNQLNIQSKIVETAKEKYDKAVAKYGKSSQEARDALNDWTDAMDAELELETEAAKLSGEIAGDIQTAYDAVIDKIQESADFAESRYELLSDILEEFQDVAEEVSETMEADTLSGSTIADLEYNLWALSEGRDATEEEIIEKKSEALQKDIEEEEEEVAELQAAYDALVADQSSTELTDNEDVIDAYKSWLSTDEGKAATETEKQAKYQELLSDAVDDAYTALLQEQISLQELKNSLEDLTEEEEEDTETTVELASNWLTAAYNAYVAVNYVQKLTTALKAYKAALASGDYDAAESIQEDMISLQSGMNSAISTALDALDIDGPVRGVVELIATAFTSNWSGVSDTVTNLFGSLFEAVTTGDWTGTLTSNLGNIFSLFTQSSDSASIFTGTLTNLGNVITSMTSESGSLGILQTILSSFTGEDGLLAQIISACTSLGSEGGVISGLINTLSGFIGSSGVLSSISTAISGFIGSSGLLSALASGFASCAGVIIAAIDSLLASIPVIGWIALAIGAIVGVVAVASNKSTEALDEALEEMEEITEAADDLDTTATVSVVVDLSSLEEAEEELDDTDWEDWEIGTSSSSSYDSASSATSAASSATSSSSSSSSGTSALIYTQVQRIANRLDSIETTISEMQVVLDTGVLVGELASGIDETLGSYATYSSRGN